MSHLALYFLGPPRVEREGEPIKITGRKALALLAYLALEPGNHNRDALAALLWPESDHNRARAELRRALSVLNRALGKGWLLVDRETAGLDAAAAIWLDVDQFRQRLADSEQRPDADSVPLLQEAVTLYRDDLLAGFTLRDSLAFDEWQFFQTDELRHALAAALERLVGAHSAEGAFESALPYARRRLALDPLHEPAHQHLMVLYARTGQQAAALRQYQLCERTLAEELGVPPSPETTALFQHIRAGDDITPEWDASTVQVLSTSQALPRHNIPAQATPFVGREAELTELDDLITDPDARLITIVGPGGMGKTRLALAAAEQQLKATLETAAETEPRFPDGIFFVSLAPLSSVEHIVPALAKTLNFQLLGGLGETRSPARQVLDYLREKRMLLVMDNFEHLLGSPPVVSPNGGDAHTVGGEELLARIVRTAPAVHVLVTSRERLHLQREQVFVIEGLPFPDWEVDTDEWLPPENGHPEDGAEYPGIKLFLQSARRVRRDFILDEDDSAALTTICHLVDGMPLGIELAASWVDTLSLAAIAGEIERSLGFLETALRDVPERHRSIQAVFDASWQRLGSAERDAFAQLSIFRGGFTRAAAREVTATQDDALPTLRTLAALVNKSLLGYNRAQDRYHVHELLRQYAADKLATYQDGTAAIRTRHSVFFCAALKRWDTDFKSARQSVALDEVEADFENVRAAWEWAATQRDVRRLDQALRGYVYYYRIHGRFPEGIIACQSATDALAEVDAASSAFPDALRVAAMARVLQAELHLFMGYVTSANTLLEQSLELLNNLALDGHDTRAERAMLLRKMGEAAFPDLDEVQRLTEESLLLYRSLGDRWGEAFGLSQLGFVCNAYGDLQAAIRLYKEGQALLRDVGDMFGLAMHLLGLVEVVRQAEDYEEASRLCGESVALSRALGFSFGETFGLFHLGVIRADSGDYVAAKQVFEECLALLRELGNPLFVSAVLLCLGELAMGEYDVDSAGERFNEALALSQPYGSQSDVAAALASLGRRALFQGRFTVSADYLRQSVDMHQETGDGVLAAVELVNLGAASCWSGEFAQAHTPITEALAWTRETEFHPTSPFVAFPTLCQAQVNVYSGRYSEARGQAQTARTLAREAETEALFLSEFYGRQGYRTRMFGKTGLIGLAHGVLGLAALAEHEYDRAHQELTDSVTIFQTVGDREQLAWSLAALGRAEFGLGNRKKAQVHLLKALGIAGETGAFIPLLHIVPIIAVVLADAERAVELHALATSHPFVANSQLFEDITSKQVAAAAATLPSQVVKAAQSRGTALDWWETAQTLLEELAEFGWGLAPDP